VKDRMEYNKRGNKWVVTKPNGTNIAYTLEEMIEMKDILKYLIKIEKVDKRINQRKNLL